MISLSLLIESHHCPQSGVARTWAMTQTLMGKFVSESLYSASNVGSDACAAARLQTRRAMTGRMSRSLYPRWRGILLITPVVLAAAARCSLTGS